MSDETENKPEQEDDSEESESVTVADMKEVEPHTSRKGRFNAEHPPEENSRESDSDDGEDD